MKKITLKRPKESFSKNSVYKILLDGKEFTELKNNEEKTLEISENSKFIKAKLLWTSSKTIALKKNKNTIIITGNKFLNKIAPFSGGIIILFSLSFILDHQYNLIKYIGITLTIITIIFFIAILTIWKDKWLNIKYES